MIALYMLTGTFMVLFFICLIIFIVHADRRRRADRAYYKKMFEELSGAIDQTQQLFRNEVKEILKGFKSIFKERNIK